MNLRSFNFGLTALLVGLSCLHQPVSAATQTSPTSSITSDVVLSPIPLTLSNSSTNVISSPGYYVVTNSPVQVLGSGTIASPHVMISITSSYVTLDLGGQVLTGSGNQTAAHSPSPTVPGGIQNDTRVDATIGIVVASGLTDVEILNGTLQYFSYEGISCTAGKNIHLHDMLIQNCSTVTAPFKGGPHPTAILFSSVTESKIDNIQFNSNRATEIYMFDCKSTVCSNIVSEGLKGGTFVTSQLDNLNFVTYGVQAAAIVSNANATLTGNVFSNIRVNDVQSLSAIFGMFLTGFPPGETSTPSTLAAVVEDCVITNLSQPVADISDILDPGTCELRGIATESLASFATIKNCKVSEITSRVTTGTGSTSYPPGLWNTTAAFNIEACAGVYLQDCNATNIVNSGWITGNQPLGVTGETYPNYWPVAGYIVQGNCQDVTFDNCFASTIDGGSATANPTLAAGFYVFEHYINDFSQNSVTFKDCKVKFVNGGEGTSDFLVDYQPPYGFSEVSPTVSSLTFENCIASNSYANQSPVPVSNGFSLNCPAQNVIFDNCQSQGHSRHGFRLGTSLFSTQTPEGFRGVLYRGCIAQGEQYSGFKLGKPYNQVSLIGCLSSNNLNGFEMDDNQVNILNCVAQFNRKDGFVVNPYFEYTAAAVTSTPLSELNIYGGDFTVMYVDPVTIQLVPNSFQNIPPSLPISGVNVTVPVPQVISGPVILVKNEPNPVNNGPYALSMIYTDLYGQSIVIYQLTRVNPWIPSNEIPEGTKVLYERNSYKQLYTLKNSIVVGLNAPLFKVKERSIKPDCSEIVIRDSQAIANQGKGFNIGKAKCVKTFHHETIDWH